MVRFMIYLFETGICLSLLYLAYWLFLRRETYFNFNRLFLVGTLLLALGVPLLHLTMAIPQGSSLENPARGVLKFRNSYEELVRQIDADFGTEPGSRHSVVGNSTSMMDEAGMRPSGDRHGGGISGDELTALSGEDPKRSRLSISALLFIIYIGGVMYFFARFVYLVIRLYLLAKKNIVSRQDGFRMVEIEEEISPFSFFRFLFINNGSFNDSELQHVLEHEKAHIRQKHTTDHLFAHALAVFQWFNPFAWQIRKALKTTHEYIADRHVIDGGIERRDYQALLLKQVIGYHSVELVNNFNLKPIKQRIAMMNKTKSGLSAKLKATLVAPFAIIIFFLFADFTLKGTESGFTVPGPDLSGLWIKQTQDDFSKAIHIRGSSFSFSEGIEIRDFHLKVEDDALVLSERADSPGTRLKYQMDGKELNLWWNNVQSTTYVRSTAKNTLDHYLLQSKQDIDLPYISQYRLMEPENSMCRIGFGKDHGEGRTVTFNGKGVSMQEVTGLIEMEREKVFFLDQKLFTVMFLVDKDIPMSQVDKVRLELRKTGSWHIAEGGYPHGDMELSPLIYHTVGLPRLLPPLNAKVLNKKEVEKSGGQIYAIDLSAKNLSPKEMDEGLQAFISNSKGGKYVISLEYDGAVPYGQYVEAVDMVWKVVYSFRDKLSQKKYSVSYDELGQDIQREMRKAYPMALSESMK
jgi:hypothetical protein